MTWDVKIFLVIAACGAAAVLWMLVTKGLRHTLGFVFGGVADYAMFAAGRSMAIYERRRVGNTKRRKSTAGLSIGGTVGLAKLMTSHDQDEEDNFGFYYESDFGPSEHQAADYSRSDSPR